MTCHPCRTSAKIVLILGGLLLSQPETSAQLIRAPLTDGFARTSSIDMSVDEMLGPRKPRAPEDAVVGPGYPDLRIAEVQFKSVRMMRMPVEDPGTTRVSNELVWYMVYRVIPRDFTELAGDGRDDLLNKLSDPDSDPANQLDPPRSLPIRLPRFVLVTEDAGEPKTYVDEVNLQIQQAVFRRELGRRHPNQRLLNSVDGIVEVLEEDTVSVNDPDPLSKALYGVAVWRNVDPATDFFSVYMSGFCNAYRITTDANGTTVISEKVIQQRFARPGDEFFQVEQEFRLVDDEDTDGDGAPDVRFPRWLYRPRSASLNVPELGPVLRNARAFQAASDQ